MSRRKQVIQSSSDDETSESSEEEYRPSQAKKTKNQSAAMKTSTAAASSQASTSSQSFTHADPRTEAEDKAHSVGLVANYFLASECKKVPVKRADLGKIIPKKHMQKDLIQAILKESSVLLTKIYGYKIEELTQKKHHYILVNTLAAPINVVSANFLNAPEESNPDETEDEEETSGTKSVVEGSLIPPDEKQGLLFVILTAVYMMDGVVEEVTLHSFLKCLGVYVDSKDPHPVFGSAKKLLDDFIKQNYLELTVQKDSDPPTKQYSWGERAHLQVCKKSILEFVCKVYGGGMQPHNWIDHYNKLVGVQESSSSVGSSVEEIMEIERT